MGITSGLQIPKVGRSFEKTKKWSLGDLTLWCHRVAHETQVGADLTARVSADPRFQQINGRLLDMGSHQETLNAKSFCSWIIWACNEFSSHIADDLVERFLNTDRIDVVGSLWVLGLEARCTTTLALGIELTPVGEMPLSADREYFTRASRRFGFDYRVCPMTAMTFKCPLRKVANSGGAEDPLRREFVNKINQLYDSCLISNAVEGLSGVPYYQTSYSASDTPMGVIGGSGGGAPILDVVGAGSALVTEDGLHDWRVLLESFQLRNDVEKAKLRLALSRLSQAKRRYSLEDKCVDLCIAVEMLILGRNANNASTKFTERGSEVIRGAYRLDGWAECLRELYKRRSDVMHAGRFCADTIKEKRDIRDALPRMVRAVEMIISSIIRYGIPNWERVMRARPEQRIQS